MYEAMSQILVLSASLVCPFLVFLKYFLFSYIAVNNPNDIIIIMSIIIIVTTLILISLIKKQKIPQNLKER